MVLVATGIHRYYRRWVLAESLGDRATCAQPAYAAFNVLACGMADNHEPESAASAWLKVQCRRCGNQWRM